MKIKDKLIDKIPVQKHPGIKKVINAVRVIKNIVCWTLIVVLAFLVVTFLINRFSGVTPTIFGYSIQRVTTGSMEPELMVGDVILSKNVDDVSTLTVGDIITFDGSAQFGEKNVTHRIIVAPMKEDGVLKLQTKGDANEIADNPIEASRVQSKMQCKLELLRTAYNLFLSPWGLIVFIALLLLIFFDELMNIVRISTGNYAEEDEESIAEIMERIQREDAEKAKKEQIERSREMVDLMSNSSDQRARKEKDGE